MSDILQRAIEEAALQMNGDELRSYQKELGECEILVKNLESDKAALTRELEAALTASQAREARLREALEIYASPDNWRQKDTRTGAFDWFLRGNAGWDIADKALDTARGA